MSWVTNRAIRQAAKDIRAVKHLLAKEQARQRLLQAIAQESIPPRPDKEQ